MRLKILCILLLMVFVGIKMYDRQEQTDQTSATLINTAIRKATYDTNIEEHLLENAQKQLQTREHN